MSDLKHCHPLLHQGASRLGRLVQTLRPDAFQLDERTIQDLIVEAHRFASTLRFFDETNTQPAGAYWENFWEVEILTYLAVLAAKDTDEIRRQFQELNEDFEQGKEAKPAPGGKKKQGSFNTAYQPLLEHLRILAFSLEDAYQKLVRIKHPLQTLLLNRIRRDSCCDQEEMEGALVKLIGYHKGADAGLQMSKYAGFFAPDKRWGLEDRIDYDAIVANPQFNLNDLNDLFNTFFNTWLVLKNAAQAGFDAELARMELPEEVEYRIVQPHVVLFLVFLRLFRHAQESLNELGTKHLDFYYEEILGLRRRGEVSDEVYLLFELAKDFDQHLLEKGTLFDAGKDKNGQPLLFETIEDWVLRPAQVADIKNTWIDLQCGGIHANPDVKKAYQNGAEKPNENAKYWRSMGDDRHLPDGQVGFAIASPQLILREGKRIIDITLNLINDIAQPEKLKSEYFKVFMSSTEDWIVPEFNPLVVPGSTSIPDLAKGAFGMSFETKAIRVRVVLERDDLPVDSFGEELASKAGFDTQWPLIKIVINPELEKPCPTAQDQNLTTAAVYEVLRTLLIGEIVVKVDVRGIRENLIIQSDQGVFDGTQKVFPFGPVPEIGNRFYIGSTEVFQKALDDLIVRVEWIAPPEDFEEHYADYYNILDPDPPEPFVQIDFIDRAQTPTPKQVVRYGNRGNSTTISGTITNIENIPLQDITVVLTGPPSGPVFAKSDAEGKYTIISSIPLNPDWSVKFIPPGQNPADPDNIVLYETLVFFSEKTGDPKTLIHVKDFTTINVVLFPKSIVFQKHEEIYGVITDIYENPLSGIAVKSQPANTSTTTDTNGAFKFADPAKPSSIEVNLPAVSLFKPLPDPIVLDDFTEVQVILEPKEIVKESGSSINISNPKVSGKISDTKNQSDLAGAFVVAQNPAHRITVFTDQGGAYELPLPDTTTSVVSFFPDTYANSILNRPQVQPGSAGIPSLDEINATLLVPKQVEKVFIKPSTIIQAHVVNHFGKPLTGVTISSTDNITFEELSSPAGAYHIVGVKEGSRLKFNKSGFVALEVNIVNQTDLQVKLLPVNNFEWAGNNRNGGIVEGTVIDRDGNGIAGIKVEVDSVPTNTTNTDANGKYLLQSGVANGAKLNFIDSTNTYVSRTGSNNINSGTLSIVNVILEPQITQSAGSINSVINGSIVDVRGKGLDTVTVIAEGHLSAGNYIKFETRTNSTGNYILDRLSDVNTAGLRLTFIKDGFVWEDNAPLATTNTVFSRHFKRSSVNQLFLTGSVREINDRPVKGARIIGPNTTAVSSDTGAFTLALPAGTGTGNFNLKIQHEAYQEIEVSVESGCINLILRLMPLTVFRVLRGMVTDIFDAPLAGVTARLISTAIESKSLNDGSYALPIPFGLSNHVEFSYPAGFESLNIDLNDSYPSQGSAFSKSLANIVLYYFSINFTSLLNEDKGIKSEFQVNINALNLTRDIRTQEFEKYSHTLKRGFIRFTLLEGDFLHEEYPKMLTWYSLFAAGQLNLDLNKDGTPDAAPSPPPIPNPPYTPATNNISLDYTSTQIITGDDNDGIDQYYHLLAFNGHKWIPLEAVKPETEPKVQMIYPYMPDDTLPVTQGGVPRPYAPGNLFIGISELTPGGTLSLLFQIADGTEPQPEALASAIHWSYLAAGNTWLPFKTGEIIRDNTNGLTRSGIIQFAVPTLAVKENTMLNPEYFWLRAAAKQADTANGESPTKVQALPSMTNIRAQVVQARFKNQDNDLAHLAQPLPAETIAKLVESRTAVKKVEQPLESFGGKLPESAGLDFYYRVSERLRHKDRAVTVWDYEHLLLEHFPEAAAAKCIQHTRYKPTKPTFKASELAPGYVTVAVIPDLKKRKGEPWPEPRFTQGDLDDMRGFLAARTNLFVAYGEETEAHLQVVNPLYEKVDVLVTVAFKPGIDEAFYKQQLQQELAYYISPWLADPLHPPAFGRTLQQSAILQFIEERHYVDYVVVDDGQFLIRMQVIDIAGRPVVFQQPWPSTGTPTETVITIKSRFVDGKICPGTARSILVAGSIVVGSIKDDSPANLPPMPAKSVPTSTTPVPPGNGGSAKLAASASSKSSPPDAGKAETAKRISVSKTGAAPAKPGSSAKAPRTTRKTNK